MIGDVNAQMYKSNAGGLVIKDAQCPDHPLHKLYGVLVNRNAIESRGIVNVKIYDKDSDIVFQSDEAYRVGVQTGTNISFQIDVGNCKAPYKYLLTITEYGAGEIPEMWSYYKKCIKEQNIKEAVSHSQIF